MKLGNQNDAQGTKMLLSGKVLGMILAKRCMLVTKDIVSYKRESNDWNVNASHPVWKA